MSSCIGNSRVKIKNKIKKTVFFYTFLSTFNGSSIYPKLKGQLDMRKKPIKGKPFASPPSNFAGIMGINQQVYLTKVRDL